MGDGIRIDNQRLNALAQFDRSSHMWKKVEILVFRYSYDLYRIQNFSLFYFFLVFFFITRFLLFNVRFQRNTRVPIVFVSCHVEDNTFQVWTLLYYLYQIGIFTKRRNYFQAGKLFSYRQFQRYWLFILQRIPLGSLEVSGFLPRDFSIVRKSDFYEFLSLTLK